MREALHLLALRVPPHAASEISDALEGDALAVSQVEIDGGAAWRVEAIYDAPPDRQAIGALLRPLYRRLGLGRVETNIEELPDRDWVVASLQVLAPVRSGRFLVHGSHDRGHGHARRWSLEIEASRAFGTGHHETTQGCLLALDRLARGFRPKTIYDLGCGTGVLAMAAARLWPRAACMAVDLDPLAVKIAAETARQNRIRLRALTAGGFGERPPRRYDLVLANVLVNPLTELAPQFRLHVNAGGHVILSGILNRQAKNLENRYCAHGFVVAFRLSLGDWSTLVLRKV